VAEVSKSLILKSFNKLILRKITSFKIKESFNFIKKTTFFEYNQQTVYNWPPSIAYKVQ
jgi:hypothetical protein